MFPRRQDGGKSPEGLFGERVIVLLMQAQDWVRVLAKVMSSMPQPSAVPAGRPPVERLPKVHAGSFLEPTGSLFLLGMCCLHFFSFNKEYVCFNNKINEVLFKSIAKEKGLRTRAIHFLP